MRAFKKLWKLTLGLCFVWLAVKAIIANNYQDVTVCFTPTSYETTPQYITLHHDAISRETTLDEINRYHKDSCKWSCGFAYHYYISEDKIYKVRDERQLGCHVLNGNSGNIGICLHGDFNKSKPTLKQQVLLICLTNYLKIKFDIQKQNIKRHQDWEENNTSCCGKNFDFDAFKKYIIE